MRTSLAYPLLASNDTDKGFAKDHTVGVECRDYSEVSRRTVEERGLIHIAHNTPPDEELRKTEEHDHSLDLALVEPEYRNLFGRTDDRLIEFERKWKNWTIAPLGWEYIPNQMMLTWLARG